MPSAISEIKETKRIRKYSKKTGIKKRIEQVSPSSSTKRTGILSSARVRLMYTNADGLVVKENCWS